MRAELGMSLKLFAPGDYSVCQCFAGTRQVASMVLSGPRLRNSGFCVMSAEKCAMDLSFVEARGEPKIEKKPNQKKELCVSFVYWGAGWLEPGGGARDWK